MAVKLTDKELAWLTERTEAGKKTKTWRKKGEKVSPSSFLRRLLKDAMIRSKFAETVKAMSQGWKRFRKQRFQAMKKQRRTKRAPKR